MCIRDRIITIQEKELHSRRQLEEVGLKTSERLPIHKRKKKPTNNNDADYECEICRANLFISHVSIFFIILCSIKQLLIRYKICTLLNLCISNNLASGL